MRLYDVLLEKAVNGSAPVGKRGYLETLLARALGGEVVVRYPITASVTNGSVSGASYIRAGQTVTLHVVPASNYTYPASVSVSGATASYNASTGALILSEPTGDVSVTAACRAIRSISVSVTNGSYSGDAQIIEGGSASVTITASEDYVLPSTVTVTGATASYNSTTGVISLSSPTANVVVAAECPDAGPVREITIFGSGAPSSCCCWLASAPGTVYNSPVTIRARSGDELVCLVDNADFCLVLLDMEPQSLTNHECRIPINTNMRVEFGFDPPDAAVVEVYTIISDLTGTEWQFGATPGSWASSMQWDVDFRSNNTDFDRLYIADEWYLYYCNSNEMLDTLVYGPDAGPPVWRNVAYRTISISGGNDVGDSDLIEFLKENATMI